MTFKLIVFDLDGTLADTETDLADSVNELRTRLGFRPLPRSRIRDGVGRGVKFLLNKKIPPVTGAASAAHPDLYLEFQKIYIRRCALNTKLFPGTRRVLAAFPRGTILAVATNKLGFLSRKILRRLKVMDRFRAIIGGDEMREPKPHPAVMLDLMKRFKATRAETVLVGDSRFDMETAKRAGVRTVACTFGFGSRAELRRWHPDATITRMAALPAALDRLSQSL